jgi:aminoglycoside phosphotransferase (APT) family kinase protein
MSDDASDVDTDRLASYLAETLGECVVDAAVIETGLNRVIRVATPDDPQAYVVRQPNSDRTDHGFVDVATEHTVLERLEPTDVPAPRAVSCCEDESVLGGPFSVIEYLDGDGIDWGDPLPASYRDGGSRARVGELLADRLSDLHALDAGRFAGVCERVDTRTQLDRTLAQLEAATSETGHEPAALGRVANWLEANAPDRPATAPVHGDYKPDNVFFTWADRPRVSGVVDWETAKLRDPRTELGYLLFYWREQGGPSPSLDDLAERHPDPVVAEIREREQRGFWPFTKRPGSPSRRELVDYWEGATGLAYGDDRFYRAFAAVMLATVWEGLYADALERGEEAADWEAHIEYVAMLAEAVVNGDLPL